VIARGLVALLALTAWTMGQEPPTPQPPAEEAGNGGSDGGTEQQEEKRKDEGQEGEKQDPPAPPPAPSGDVQQPPVETPVPTPVEAPVAENTAPPAPAAPAREPIRAPLDADGIVAALRDLNAAHPELTHIELLGRSAQGREILALTLGAMAQTDGGEPAGRPTLLLVEHRGFESLGPEASIELVWRLAERATTDAVLRALLQSTALVIAPALDPDARLTGAPSRPVRFDENFPSGWQPETIRPGAGKVSLSMPESLAAAGFLARLKHAALVIGFAPAVTALAPYPEAELPDDDRQVLTRIVSALDIPGRPSAISWFDLGSHGGGLLDFAYQARGILPIVLPLPPEASSGAEGLAAWTSEVSERVVRCLALLPRIEIHQEGLERLAPDTWQLDVRIQNAGLLPTQSALSLRREPGSDVALELEGAKLLATARRAHAAADYQDASFHATGGRAALSGGTLAGGEARWLRLILESSTESAVRVTAATRWAGTASLAVTLP
jgi:hypothetical protein